MRLWNRIEDSLKDQLRRVIQENAVIIKPVFIELWNNCTTMLSTANFLSMCR